MRWLIDCGDVDLRWRAEEARKRRGAQPTSALPVLQQLQLCPLSAVRVCLLRDTCMPHSRSRFRCLYMPVCSRSSSISSPRLSFLLNRT